MNDKVRQYVTDLRGTSLHPLMEEVLKLAERAMELEADKERLDWLLPILHLAEGNGDAHAIRLALARFLLNLDGRDAIDAAMKEGV